MFDRLSDWSSSSEQPDIHVLRMQTCTSRSNSNPHTETWEPNLGVQRSRVSDGKRAGRISPIRELSPGTDRREELTTRHH